MSVASFVETSVVVSMRSGYDGLRDLDLFMSKTDIASAIGT
jgi:hypothetical protein